MQKPIAIIFVGLQATGKSTYYWNNFKNSHLRISNDLLGTKNRENKLLEFCAETQMPFVVDNTNLTKEKRHKYIEFCHNKNFKCICFYFKTELSRSLKWNKKRCGKDLVPDVAIFSSVKKLELPSFDEGFDELWYLDFDGQNFIKKPWQENEK